MGPAGSNEDGIDQREGSEDATTRRNRNKKIASFMVEIFMTKTRLNDLRSR